jgi:hypothetical protein
MKDQVRNETRGPGRLWDVWVKHGILTQDRGRGESPLRFWRRSDPRKTRQRRLDVIAKEIGSPRAQRRDRRIDEIRTAL